MPDSRKSGVLSGSCARPKESLIMEPTSYRPNFRAGASRIAWPARISLGPSPRDSHTKGRVKHRELHGSKRILWVHRPGDIQDASDALSFEGMANFA
jgi:hypothetical protein